MKYASLFLLIFGVLCALYGLAIYLRPTKGILPVAVARSVRHERDIRRAGVYTALVGLAIAAVFGTMYLLS